MDTLMKKLKNIQDIRFESYIIEQDKQLFHHLNNKCKNWKVLHCNCFRENFDYQNIDVIHVMERIQHLKIDLSTLLRFTFAMNNLIELTIYPNFKDEMTITETTFCNLIKLNIYNFLEMDFNIISKFYFPKLECYI